MRKDLEFNGDVVRVLTVDGCKIWVDSEWLTNENFKHARIVHKYRGKWYFTENKPYPVKTIHKDNIKFILTDADKLKKLKNIIDWLATHNKNYTKEQYYKIIDALEIFNN